MSWYNTQGQDQDHVLFSKVRYIRNIAKQNFCHLIDEKRASETFAKLESILQKNGFRGEKLGTEKTHTLLSLREKQFIESDHVFSGRCRALYLNEPCNLTVALGGDNYITISSIVSGRSVEEAMNIASRAEELFDREIDLAYSESIGYLSPVSSDSGSGVCFSSALYLPSLKSCGCDSQLRGMTASVGITLEPMFSEAAGGIYIMSYVPHFLACEKSAASFFANAVSRMIELERKSLSELYSGSKDILYDRARKAMGILLYSDILSESELIKYLSEIRLCLVTSETHPESLPDIATLNYLCAEGMSSSVIASSKAVCISSLDCDRARAKLVSAYIKHKKEAGDSNGK